MKLIFKILFFITILFGNVFSQDKTKSIAVPNPAELLPFVQDTPKVDSMNLAKLKGLEFSANLLTANLRARHFIWKISKQPDYSVYEFVVDTLHIFFLNKCIKPDQNPSASIIKIVDILTVVNDNPNQIIEAVFCSHDNVVDDRIFALVNFPSTKGPFKYFAKVARAWHVNTNENRFNEISPKNIKCLNKYYNSKD